jgi:hypothetical protein
VQPDRSERSNEDPTSRRLGNRVLALLPGATMRPTGSDLQIEHDYDGETRVVVVITPTALELRLPTVIWEGPQSPVPSTRLWRRIGEPDLTGLNDTRLQLLLEAAKEARAAEWATCRYRQARVPVEHRLDGRDLCHGCASGHEGVCF